MRGPLGSFHAAHMSSVCGVGEGEEDPEASERLKVVLCGPLWHFFVCFVPSFSKVVVVVLKLSSASSKEGLKSRDDKTHAAITVMVKLNIKSQRVIVKGYFAKRFGSII